MVMSGRFQGRTRQLSQPRVAENVDAIYAYLSAGTCGAAP